MTPRQIELIEDSWDFILTNSQEAGMIFYDRLFEIDPSLKDLFRESTKEQSKKLVAMITFLVSKLNSIEDVVGDVKALGKRHANYRVKQEHYDIVANALLWTLGKALGKKWTDELKDAWTTLYVMLAQIMIQASQEKK